MRVIQVGNICLSASAKSVNGFSAETDNEIIFCLWTLLLIMIILEYSIRKSGIMKVAKQQALHLLKFSCVLVMKDILVMSVLQS